MHSVFNDIKSLFYRPVCPVCGCTMGEGEYFVCSRCRWEAPLTDFQNRVDNPVVQRFWGTVKVANGCAFMYFVHNSGWRTLIHEFKYHGRWREAMMAGEWFGGELARSPLYGDVDLLVPVPLHPRKLLSRTYNQAEYLALGMGRSMGLKVDSHSVVRKVYNKSQALRPHHERWENVKDIFRVTHPEKLSGHHILLVDDVLTTGATIGSCAEAIEQAVPDCRISIACFATAFDPLS